MRKARTYDYEEFAAIIMEHLDGQTSRREYERKMTKLAELKVAGKIGGCSRCGKAMFIRKRGDKNFCSASCKTSFYRSAK